MMSLILYKIALVLAGLICRSLGRRLQTAPQSPDSPDAQTQTEQPLQAFEKLLLAGNPVATLRHLTFPVHRPFSASSHPMAIAPEISGRTPMANMVLDDSGVTPTGQAFEKLRSEAANSLDVSKASELLGSLDISKQASETLQSTLTFDIGKEFTQALASLQDLTTSLLSLPGTISSQVVDSLATLLASVLGSDVANKLPVAEAKQVAEQASQAIAGLDPAQQVQLFLASALSPILLASIFGFGRDEEIGAPYAADRDAYDPVAADRFYISRLPTVISRLLKVGSITFSFNIRLALDYWAYCRAGKPEGESWPNECDRAKEALELATQLGPTFIKLAQALSIRTDLIPEAYALELRQLQDAVPPFDSEEAKKILARELRMRGGPSGLSTIFNSLSATPLAAASIGQVYKGILKDGRTVAVKVQRPDILDEIALDLYLLRFLTPLQTRISNYINKLQTYPDDIKLATDLVDEWGRGFVAETDYLFEAANTKSFSEAMDRRGLGAVTAPAVVEELSTRKVLVTEWVDGTRLDLDKSPDVPRLCGVAINAYLTMLLDTGVLHCDPHPGNLLRTLDGRLCILDWGMTLGVPPDLQYSLIEFIAHVNAEDYDAMPADFVKLGFTPEDQLERLYASNLTEGLSFVLRQLSQGGGGKKLQQRVREEWRQKYDPEGKLTLEEMRAKAREDMTNQAREALEKEGVEGASVMDVQGVMEKMQQRNRELFKVPPYILYVARAFSTLEGIGLSGNEDYSIVSEAFPYLSRRLLTDTSPRAKAALRSMVYGSEDKDASNATPNFGKMLSIGEGFTSYSTATAEVPAEAKLMGGGGLGAATMQNSGGDGKTSTADSKSTPPDTDAATEGLIDLLLSADGNYVQELLLEEAAKLADAAVRDSIAQAGTSAPINALADALRAPKQWAQSTLGQLPLPGPFKAAMDAALMPATVLDEISRLVPTLARTSESDQDALKSFGDLWDKFNTRSADTDDVVAMGSDAAPEQSTSGNGVLPTFELPPALATVQTNAGPLLEQLADEDSRLRQRLPLIGTLSRRFGAILLRRVARRLEEDGSGPNAPSLARGLAARAAEADRSLADIIEPVQLDEEEDKAMANV
jgi:predicted unusual protein kinase regulating ubiquinone biosynthesis (AarF/ABC1/UbiB family)